jgi:hypothetical protein
MVAAYGDGARVELPPAPGEPHVFTNLAAWINAWRAPIIRRFFARGFRRPRQHRRVRPSGTRGSPAGADSSGSSDDPAPFGLLRVGAGTWLLAEIVLYIVAFHLFASAVES